METKDKETISLNTIIVKYLLHWKLFLAVFLFSFIPAILYLKIAPRTYEFNASILLQEEKDSGMTSLGSGSAASLMKSFGIGSSGGSSINVDDEMEVLASNRMLRMMILDLGINIIYYEPFSLYKMYREAPLKLTVDSMTVANLQDEIRFNISVTPGKISVKASTKLGKWKDKYTFSSLPATIRIGADDFTLDFDHDGAAGNTFKLKIKCLPASWMAESLSKNLEVEDVSSASKVLFLKYSDHSRQRGLDMLTTLIQNYNADVKSFLTLENIKIMSYVDNRIAMILDELAVVENNLEAFKKKNDMTLLEVDVTLYGESFKELQAALIEGEMISHQIDLLDVYLQDPANKYKAIPSVFSVDEGEKGVIMQFNKALVLREKLLNNSNELNMMYQEANREVELLREAVNTMIGNARKNATKTLTELKSREKQLMSKFKSVPEKEREYVVFVRDQEIMQGLYLLMLQKKEETIFTLNKKTDRARLIEPPYIKKKPLGPRKLYAAIGIMILTLVIPVGSLFVKDLLSSIIKEYKQ